jgi:hypothetical protein
MISKKHLFYALCGFIISCNSLSGAVFCKINTAMPLKCIFSNFHQNRIAVDKGRIEKVIFTDDSIAMRMEEESGQVFVVSVKPNYRETVISLVTDRGFVVVILQEALNSSNNSSYAHQNIGILIEKILAGQTPEDYCCFAVNERTRNDWEWNFS